MLYENEYSVSVIAHSSDGFILRGSAGASCGCLQNRSEATRMGLAMNAAKETMESGDHTVSEKKRLARFRRHWREFSLQASALLVIDMQEYFLRRSSHAFVPSARNIIAPIQWLLRLYRARSRPTVFTYFGVRRGEDDPVGRFWGETVRDGSRGSRLIAALPRGNTDLVLRKKTYSAFYGTHLERSLRRRGVESLLITGVLTNLCCETTARDAFVRGFDVFFAADATAALSNAMHRASLENLAYGFATPLWVRDLRKRFPDVP